MRDPEFGVVRVTAFGIYTLRIQDAKTMLIELVGTKADFTTEDIEENLRGKIGLRIKEVMPRLAYLSSIWKVKSRWSASAFANVSLPTLLSTVWNCAKFRCKISACRKKWNAIDQQGAMRVIGNMNQFAQYQGAQALRDAANNPGMAGGMMGVGVGGMLTQSMGNLFQNQTTPSSSGSRFYATAVAHCSRLFRRPPRARKPDHSIWLRCEAQSCRRYFAARYSGVETRHVGLGQSG